VKEYFEKLTSSIYFQNFKEYLFTHYELHETHFQNFAIKILKDITSEGDNSFASKLLTRSLNFAISTREDINWLGQEIHDPSEIQIKKNQLTEYHMSAKLYDWCLCPTDYLNELLKPKYKQLVSPEVLYMDTLKAVDFIHKKLGYSGLEIAWLNFANAHNVGGAYNRGMGTQEENTITESTAAGTLTMFADPNPINNAIKKSIIADSEIPVQHPKQISYRKNKHLPPGGTYICKTRLLLKSEPQYDCYMIASASADFREITEFRPYSEKGQFEPNSLDYEKRISIDMEAVCLTAIKHNIKVLILGATGCGAFLHDPDREATLWKKVIHEKFGYHFERIYFSILGEKNYNHFLNHFPAAPMAMKE